MNREAWPDGPPELGDVDLEEQPAALVAEALPWDLDGPGGDTVRSPLHRPSCTTSHLAIGRRDLADSRRESSSAGVIASSGNGFVTSGVASYVPPRGRSRSVTTIPIP
jgi:hypothetical protein